VKKGSAPGNLNETDNERTVETLVCMKPETHYDFFWQYSRSGMRGALDKAMTLWARLILFPLSFILFFAAANINHLVVSEGIGSSVQMGSPHSH
jgi:hypothetical protein